MTKKYSQQLLEASKKFTGTKYQSEVEKASKAYLTENYTLMSSILSKLPTEPQLLASLLEKLKGKSVEKGIRKIQSRLPGRLQTINHGEKLLARCQEIYSMVRRVVGG